MNKWLQQPSRYFVDLVLYIIIIGCLVFFSSGDYLKLSGYAISFGIIIYPFYLYSKSLKLQKIIKKSYVEIIQIIIAFCCYTNLLGSLAFYKILPGWWWYDTIIHFINPILIFSITPVFVILYQSYFFHKSKLYFILVGNFVLIIFGSFFWEFYETLIDSIFTSSNMLGQNGEIYFDTFTDLIADFAGGIIASLLIYYRFYGNIIRNFNLNGFNEN